MRKFTFTLLTTLLIALCANAQSRDYTLTLAVTDNYGSAVTDASVTLLQADYSLSYGTITLDSEGKASLKVYAGNHTLTASKSGYETATKNFYVSGDTAVTIALTEETQLPFSLDAIATHNASTGLNDLLFTWNQEAPVFFDGFEDYDAFAINFGEWIGIDADGLVAAPLVGNYLNRAVMQYAQIINPLVVEPAWWYDYPILRPYAGQQYVGFTRTYSGEANDDWLISPVITPGNLNELSFKAKAADVYKEKFQVFVTEVIDNPKQSDFTLINEGNYETADYKGWRTFSYDLSAYAGKQIRFAIRYISESNNGGAFMLMVDNVYVGQAISSPNAMPNKARRVPARSAMNPNESFRVYLNGELKGTTEDYEWTFTDLPNGTYRLGVQAVYSSSETEIVDTVVTINFTDAALRVVVNTNNNESADGGIVEITDTKTGDIYVDTIANGAATFPYMPLGEYLMGVTVPHFDIYEQQLTVNQDTTVTITLTETIIDPYNVTSDITHNGKNDNDVQLRWNQNISFNDSFEDYEDFATGSFGGWNTWDLDQHNTYPIGLGSSTNIVTFPGASTPTNPCPTPPMVFNPWSTEPAMMPTDNAVAAPTGDKTVIFFSPQQNGANKWLVSPEITIRENFVCRFTAKAYAQYTESMSVCVFDPDMTSPETDSYVTVSTIDDVNYGNWMIYETDLSDYVGSSIRIGVHYTSYDAFFAQIDDFYVGNLTDDGSTIDVGNVLYYIVWLDGDSVGTTTNPEMLLTGVSDGHHTATIQAVYASGKSKTTTYEFDTPTATTGDVNNDGEVNIADVNALISIILGNSTADDYEGVADVNGDDEINIADVNAVIAIILGS